MIKLTVSALLFLVILQTGMTQTLVYATFMNPVIPGDHPDCTLTKVGDHFYTTGSSFNPTPVIYHSTDLVHWEAIAQPVSASWTGYGDSPGGGCWGGQLVYYGGKYWHFFSRANTMYFVKADQPAGPWSAPVRINNPASLSYGLGYDNSVFVDDDNKWYLVVKNGQANNGIVELGNTGQPTGVVYDLNWLNPDPSYPYSWAEGPVMWKYGAYYYYSFARDVAGGQKVMRSKTLTAQQTSWEILGDFFNESDPLKPGSLFTGPNHASQAVMLGDSTSWVIHPVYAKGEWKGQGRQGLLNQVRYNANLRPVADYPVNQSFPAPKRSSGGIPWMVPHSDHFTASALHPEWSFLGYTATTTWSLSERPGWLRLSPKSSTKANTVIKNDGEHNYALVTCLDFSPASAADEAGLRIIRGDETQFVKLFSSVSASGNKSIVFSYGSTRYEAENRSGDTLWLKMVRVNHKISGYFSRDGINYVQLGQAVDVSAIDAFSDFASWAGTRQGLYVQGTQKAWFDLYLYRDAFTPVLAECPANQQGTSRASAADGTYMLDNIHPGDWAMFAGVEFGPAPLTVDSVEFTAASAGSGGTIRLYLDSVNGTKIAECTIGNTGNFYTWKRFTAPVEKVMGNHDLYLLFSGSGSGKLFTLKWLRFIPENKSTGAALLKESRRGIQVWPNPAVHQVSVHSGFRFRTSEIFNAAGQRVFFLRHNETHNLSLDLNLEKGLYLLKISNENEFETAKFLIN